MRFLEIKVTAKSSIDETVNPTKYVSRLRFDGIYRSDVHDGAVMHMRFYKDNAVVTAAISVGGDLRKIKKWFTAENKGRHSHGTYTVDRSQIRFSSISSSGAVDYEGTIDGEVITLKSHSRINGYRGVQEVKFCKI